MSERHDALTKSIWNPLTGAVWYQAQQTLLLSLILDELQEIKGRIPAQIPGVISPEDCNHEWQDQHEPIPGAGMQQRCVHCLAYRHAEIDNE